jgi:hypothetical protein
MSQNKKVKRKRYITCLDKIAEDDVYNEQQRKLAIRLKEKVFQQ